MYAPVLVYNRGTPPLNSYASSHSGGCPYNFCFHPMLLALSDYYLISLL